MIHFVRSGGDINRYYELVEDPEAQRDYVQSIYPDFDTVRLEYAENLLS